MVWNQDPSPHFYSTSLCIVLTKESYAFCASPSLTVVQFGFKFNQNFEEKLKNKSQVQTCCLGEHNMQVDKLLS